MNPPSRRPAGAFDHVQGAHEIMAELEFVEALRQYFRAEKLESVAIVAGSAVLLATGAVLLASATAQFARGLAAVLLLTGVIGAIVGGTIVLRTDRQVADLVRLYETDRTRFASTEGPRIERVAKSFRTYRATYVVAVLLALALLVLSHRPLLHGLGVGLLLFAALGFTVDHFAETRAIDYEARVRSAAALPAAR